MTQIKWGAEIPCNGRPDWLKDDDVCAVFSTGSWCGTGKHYETAKHWAFHSGVTAFKLPADHPYYTTTASMAKLSRTIGIHEAIATLETAGYTVTKPDPYVMILNEIKMMAIHQASGMGEAYEYLRRAIPDPASIDVAALAGGKTIRQTLNETFVKFADDGKGACKG